MMKFNPEIHHRRSIRLKGYDYSCEDLYFITICCYDRICVFGNIVTGVQNFEPGNIPGNNSVGAQKFVPGNTPGNDSVGVQNAGVQNFEPLRSPPKNEFQKIIPRSIGSIVRGYKIGVTKWFHQHTEVHRVWEHNYYEHIIRDDKSYWIITEYIINNPTKWDEDRFYCA